MLIVLQPDTEFNFECGAYSIKLFFILVIPCENVGNVDSTWCSVSCFHMTRSPMNLDDGEQQHSNLLFSCCFAGLEDVFE